MKKETVYDILIDYLEQRKSAKLDSQLISERLTQIGKTEDEIYELLIEFDDEWDREQMYIILLKKAKLNLYGGTFLAVGFAVISILSALNVVSIGGATIIFYGAVAAGILAALWGLNTLKKHKLRDERLKIKYLN